MKTAVLIVSSIFLFAQALFCQATEWAYRPAPVSMNAAATPKKVPIYAGLGTVTLAGAGIMAAGFVQRTDAVDNRKLFNTYSDPNDNFYLEIGQTRDELESSYKSGLKKSNLLIYGGAAVAATSIAILVNRIVWIKRIERSKASRTGLAEPPVPFSVTGTTMGIGLSYHF